MKKKSKYEKAYFVQRLFAYIIDIVLIMLISSIITSPFVNVKSVEKLNSEINQIADNYVDGKISMGTYASQAIDLSYEEMKVTGFSNVISVTILVLYFIVFQVYQEGQTLGKKLMKIKIVKCDKSGLTMNDMIVRSLLTNSILADILVITVTLFGKNTYFYGASIIKVLQYIFVLTTALMIIIRKDGRGLADMASKTKVVSLALKVKEEELCES